MIMKKFGELKKSVNNISLKTLTSNLRQMETSDIIQMYAEVPPKVEYDLGLSLKPVLDSMVKWGENYRTIKN